MDVDFHIRSDSITLITFGDLPAERSLRGCPPQRDKVALGDQHSTSYIKHRGPRQGAPHPSHGRFECARTWSGIGSKPSELNSKTWKQSALGDKRLFFFFLHPHINKRILTRLQDPSVSVTSRRRADETRDSSQLGGGRKSQTGGIDICM